MNKYMKIAFEEALKGMESGEGGPFGACVVKDGEIIAAAHNKVILSNDPTMHAEIAAIRAACEKLSSFDLNGCEIYSTCQPCPMCLGAIFWAKIPRLYYGCSEADAEKIGFADKLIYEAIRNGLENQNNLNIYKINRNECLALFEKWEEKQDKNMY
ncbi:MAG: nucleoside deaminase [Oscillospiraceae bacterium]|nr:nucleoside deaminase [Oscillospiraceae bacterium]